MTKISNFRGVSVAKTDIQKLEQKSFRKIER